MSKLILLVGPPGSGKSTLAKKYVDEGFTYINQDLQGADHITLYDLAILGGANVVLDRMNFSVKQRERYLWLSKEHSYETEIIVLHQPYDVCLQRCLDRVDHLTIKDGKAARSALDTFFTKYERVQDSEADKVTRIWPEGEKAPAIISDLDGTLCDVSHRLHFVRKIEGQKKDWKSFFNNMDKDKINFPVYDILFRYNNDDTSTINTVFCSGRPDNYREMTKEWLKHTGLLYSALFMRHRNDSRPDDIVKEIILDFEILTRYKPFFILDDRDRVVNMWRRRGFTCLQVAEGNF